MNEKKVVFHGKPVKKVYAGDNDFKIYAFDVDLDKYNDVMINQYGNVSVSGKMIELDLDVDYEIEAIENTNGKYGISYSATIVKRNKPVTESEVYSFLCTILTKNQAMNLYAAYPNIVDKIMNNGDGDVDLSRVKGVKQKSYEKVKKKVIENFALMELLAKYKDVLSYTIIQKLYNTYGSIDLINERLRRKPYECLCQLSRVGFLTADEIIKNIQKKNEIAVSNFGEPLIPFVEDIITSKDRCLFCIVYNLEKNEEQGHTYIDLESLKNQISACANECADKIMQCLNDYRIFYDKESQTISLRNTYNDERYIAETIKMALKINDSWGISGIERFRKVNDDIILTDEQFAVLKEICSRNIVILNGPGGSGKTSVMAAVINLLEAEGKTYLLMAPTGKAAKVLSEYAGKEATTIHRGLQYYPGTGFGINSENQFQKDIIIVDEVSMIDVGLMSSLLKGIDFNKTKLLLVGDAAQLPSVGCGNVLHDFINSSVLPVISLSKIFRYNEGGLMMVATDIRTGKKYLDHIESPVTKFGNGDYYFINTQEEKAVDVLISIYNRLIKNKVNVYDIQVLSAMKMGNYGCRTINSKIQEIVNPNVKLNQPLYIRGVSYYKGDIVIQTVNNYHAQQYDMEYDSFDVGEKFIANGEIGKIIDIKDDIVVIDFDGIVVGYNKEEMSMVDLGYCITVHKSQGSSAKYVLLCTPSAHTFMLNSNLLYVGVTRTKKCCYHVGDLKAVNGTIWKKENYNRKTRLKKLLH